MPRIVEEQHTPDPEDVPDVLYHRAHRKNLRSILRQGLIPSRDRLGNEPAVWMLDSPSGIAEQMNQAELSISTRGLDPRSFTTWEVDDGDEITGVYVYGGKIPPGNISVYEG